MNKHDYAMKKFKYLLLALPLTAFIACGGGIGV
jgi:hypothetical protein